MRSYFSNDIEGGPEASELFEDKMVRHNFIKKVFFILFIQLLITGGIVTGLMFIEEFMDFITENPVVLIIAVAVSFVLTCVLSCCTEYRRKPPMNYICLGGITVALSIILGTVCAHIDPMIVLTAVGITAAVCFVLTIFAMQTQWDFTVLTGFLCICCVVGICFGIALIFIRDRTLHLVYCSLGVVLFSLFLIIDIQSMLGGNHKYSMEPDEYVFAAMSLYIDVFQIFTCILRLLNE